MARLLSDHHLSRHLVSLLRHRNHDVVTTRELGLDRASDGWLLLTAAELDRILVTDNDGDFVLLHDAWPRWMTAWGIAAAHPGIVLPQDQRWNLTRAAQEIEAVLRLRPDVGHGVPLTNQLWIWRPARGWFEGSPVI